MNMFIIPELVALHVVQDSITKNDMLKKVKLAQTREIYVILMALCTQNTLVPVLW